MTRNYRPRGREFECPTPPYWQGEAFRTINLPLAVSLTKRSDDSIHLAECSVLLLLAVLISCRIKAGDPERDPNSKVEKQFATGWKKA